MARRIPITFFAPAERWPLEVVQRQAKAFHHAGFGRLMHRAALNYLLILNPRRQIIMASDNVAELLPDRSVSEIIGLRLGEAVGCIHHRWSPGGCGTTRVCQRCAAIQATLRGLAGRRALRECHIIRFVNGRSQTLSLRVLATPLSRNRERFTLLTMAAIHAQSL